MPTRTDFGSLTQAQQLAHLRSIAHRALVRFGIPEYALKLCHHAYNTTYRVDTPFCSWALRINVNSNRTVEQVRGEVAWIEALADETEISVPKPVRTLDDEPLVLIESPHFPIPRTVVLYEWLEGRHTFRRAPAQTGLMVGQIMRRLHQHGAGFQFPPGASRPLLESVLESVPWRAPETPVFLEPYRLATEALARQSVAPPQIVHFDIHLGNVKVANGRMHLFDFDDCVRAWPMVDAAQSMFYFRKNRNAPILEGAFWEGLGSLPPDQGMSVNDFEALVAGRALLLVNDLLGTVSSALETMAQRWLPELEFQLRNFLDTGRYDSSLVPPN